ncbi:MmgE/PrpD family protein [Bordetella sp. BOR01]|uniref:MmgE/PrpD family protein n=1 Tax=Bordetella sp. BOR01 TaxID=2854779 RepID=UPI001C47036C|nr:MmgE/PrpD family protein [Bordetella sp. BOR01]MBV7484072.1 MmgE/PrpD family protein [Bordetella sp. BOR01]
MSSLRTASPHTDQDRLACEQGLQRLFSWAVAVRPDEIPADARRRARQILFDDISAMAGAWHEPEFQRLYPVLMQSSRGSVSTVFCQPGTKADPETAAVVNAVSANWLELDEGYRTTPCHAGLYVLPALLASAEADGTSMDTMIATLAVAYELITRVAQAFPQQPAVMQSHGRFAALGAAMAVSLHRRLTASQLMDAASAAVTLITPAPRNHLALGALVRNVWAAAGARSGMNVVDWAAAGIAGSPGGIYDVYCTVLRGGFRPEALTEGLGESWAVTRGYTKMYACCQHLHAAVEAALDIRVMVWEKGVDNVAGIHVLTHELALPLQNARPHNTLSAKFSMAHAIAAALLAGQGGATAFHSGTVADSAMQALRERVTMAPWPEPIPPAPNDRPARVEIRFTDGSSLAGECLSARGGADRPFAPDELMDKIRQLTSETFPGLAEVAARVIEGHSPLLGRPWPETVRAMQARALTEAS